MLLIDMLSLFGRSMNWKNFGKVDFLVIILKNDLRHVRVIVTPSTTMVLISSSSSIVACHSATTSLDIISNTSSIVSHRRSAHEIPLIFHL